MDILALFLIGEQTGKNIQSFTVEFDVSHRLSTDPLYQVEELPFYFQFVECSIVQSVLNSVKCFFS